MAALDQYFGEAVSQTDSFGEDNSYSEKWESGADSDRNDSNGFDCNICLDCVQDPVVTLCGHLYCWSCIYKWFHFHNLSNVENGEEQSPPECPVCKTEVSQSSLVPIYGRGQTTNPSSGKSHHVSTMIPQRPHGPLSVFDPRRSFNATTSAVPHRSSQYYHSHYPYYHHPQQFNSIPSSSNSGMLGMGMDGALRNAFDSRIGVFGEMIYARVFGNQVTDVYSYPNTYNLAGNSNPRIRRHLMQADKQLNRICFFLLCSLVLCLLLF